MTVDQSYLNNYFKNTWTGSTDKFKETGLAIANNIQPHEWVLDVGCGRNPFKGIITNLVGIDPAFSEADQQLTIAEYQPDRLFDVALCLGSINFGTLADITAQIEKVISCLKPNARIYWRCNPGLKDHGNTECNNIDFFPWTVELHYALSKHYGFTLQAVGTESVKQRIYAEWIR